MTPALVRRGPMTDLFAANSATDHSITGDARRRGGWLPSSQDALEDWLSGHRERVAAKGGQAVLHPVLAEFQTLIDSDPVVRLAFRLEGRGRQGGHRHRAVPA
jgi:hypothetical protein